MARTGHADRTDLIDAPVGRVLDAGQRIKQEVAREGAGEVFRDPLLLVVHAKRHPDRDQKRPSLPKNPCRETGIPRVPAISLCRRSQSLLTIAFRGFMVERGMFRSFARVTVTGPAAIADEHV